MSGSDKALVNGTYIFDHTSNFRLLLCVLGSRTRTSEQRQYLTWTYIRLNAHTRFWLLTDERCISAGHFASFISVET
jgi:hypothetical protein